MKKLLVMLLLFGSVALAQTRAPEAEQFVGKPKGVPLQGAALDSRTYALSALLRCPVCQGLSIADSPSEMAINMRGQVRQLLSRGFSDEQILSYFEHSYGQFVLLKPKFSGFVAIVWALPLLLLLLGAAIVVVKARGAKTPEPVVVQKEMTSDDYLSRVREMVKQ